MTHDDRDLPVSVRNLAAVVASARVDRFAPGFADRVAQRLARDAAAAPPLVLPRHVRRVVPLVAAASLALAATNWWSARDAGGSALARALGIPVATVADALTLSNTPTP